MEVLQRIHHMKRTLSLSISLLFLPSLIYTANSPVLIHTIDSPSLMSQIATPHFDTPSLAHAMVQAIFFAGSSSPDLRALPERSRPSSCPGGHSRPLLTNVEHLIMRVLNRRTPTAQERVRFAAQQLLGIKFINPQDLTPADLELIASDDESGDKEEKKTALEQNIQPKKI